MTRILCILSSLNMGGAETFMMKLYRKLDRERYQMDFIVSAEGVYDKEVDSLGGKIYRIPLRTEHPFGSFFAIRKIVKENKYNSVLKLCDTPIGVTDLLAARMGGAKRVCVRSCNASSDDSRLKETVNSILRPLFNRLAKVKFAPSLMAAEYTFGKKCVEKGKVSLLHNAVDIDHYSFNEEAGKNIRKELGVSEDAILFGHVGRFSHQKNHKFLIEIFEKINRQSNEARLVLVGSGGLENEIKDMVRTKGLSDKVLFLGNRSDIPEILSALNVFLLPSFYEGLPNTVVEAQATGLSCLVADTVTREANVAELVEYLPLGEAELWAEKCLAAASAARADSEYVRQAFLKNKYDIGSIVEEFLSLVVGR